MKAATEAVSPTRVRLTVEVPFDELKPSLDAAYKKLAGQVRIQGFRPGKVPPRILDQRLGRGAILDEALQDALPRFYGEAIRDTATPVLGRPEVDVTAFADGEPLVFTAEVDRVPEFDIPPYNGLTVSVDSPEPTEADIAARLATLQERFASLESVERPVQNGDFITLDLAATVDGEAVPNADATGLSYEVGSGSLVKGLDDAVTGLAAGAATAFDTELVAGEFAGRTAQVSVTVRSVKVKKLPALDDDFATTASEFDTLDELTADLTKDLQRAKRLEVGVAARDKVLEALVELADFPLPEAAVTADVEARRHQLHHQLDNAGLSLAGWLRSQDKAEEEFLAELRTGSEQSVKAQLLLDKIADAEEVGISDADLSDQIVRRAMASGVEPQTYADEMVRNGQLGALVTEIRRGKALALVLESAVITDPTGATLDLEQLVGSTGPVPADGDDDSDNGHRDHDGHRDDDDSDDGDRPAQRTDDGAGGAGTDTAAG